MGLPFSGPIAIFVDDPVLMQSGEIDAGMQRVDLKFNVEEAQGERVVSSMPKTRDVEETQVDRVLKHRCRKYERSKGSMLSHRPSTQSTIEIDL